MKRLPVFALVATLAVSAAHADDYRDARAELIAAYQAQDFPAMVLAADKALAARPGFPGALFNLALAQTLNGQHDDSFRTLEKLADIGVDMGVGQIDEFASVRELDGWGSLAARVEALYEPQGAASVYAEWGDPNFVPEGIAFGADGEMYLGSVRRGQLVRATGEQAVVSDRGGHWSVFGMRLHPDGSLWFASSAVAQLENVGEEAGRAGLFRISPDDGEISRAAILPDHAENQVLGDLVIADADTLYTTDSITGAVYRYRIQADAFETLVAPGLFGSPQGLVLDESGESLYVADYIGGLYRVSLSDGAIEKVRMPKNVTDYGIDGLYRLDDELIAIQNGIRPHRVVSFRLSDDGDSAKGSVVLASNLPQFDEPTLGVVRKEAFYFVANSHWNRFDQDNNLPEGLSGPVILKISLR